MDYTRCVKKVMSGYHSHQCTRKIWKDGYCKQHHPNTVKARNEESNKRWEEKRKQSPRYKLEIAQKRIQYLEELLDNYTSEHRKQPKEEG